MQSHQKSTGFKPSSHGHERLLTRASFGNWALTQCAALHVHAPPSAVCLMHSHTAFHTRRQIHPHARRTCTHRHTYAHSHLYIHARLNTREHARTHLPKSMHAPTGRHAQARTHTIQASFPSRCRGARAHHIFASCAFASVHIPCCASRVLQARCGGDENEGWGSGAERREAEGG